MELSFPREHIFWNGTCLAHATWGQRAEFNLISAVMKCAWCTIFCSCSYCRVATVRDKSGKNRFFSRSGKSQGIVCQVREFLNSTWKSVKSQGVLRLSSHLVLERDSLVVKVISFKKILQRCWFLLALLPKDLPWMVSEIKSQGNVREFVLSQWVATLYWEQIILFMLKTA